MTLYGSTPLGLGTTSQVKNAIAGVSRCQPQSYCGRSPWATPDAGDEHDPRRLRVVSYDEMYVPLVSRRRL
jgi:hypothetical protein